jgi:hypothetical protein
LTHSLWKETLGYFLASSTAQWTWVSINVFSLHPTLIWQFAYLLTSNQWDFIH